MSRFNWKTFATDMKALRLNAMIAEQLDVMGPSRRHVVLVWSALLF